MQLEKVRLDSLLRLGTAIDFAPGYTEGQRRAIEMFGCPVVVINRTTMHLLTNRVHLAIIRQLHETGAPAPRHGEDWLMPCILGDWPADIEKAVAIWLNGGINGNLSAKPYADSIQSVLLNYTPENWQDASAIGLDTDDLLYLLDTLADDLPIIPPAIEPPADSSWGIPQLDPALQGRAITDAVKWGTVARSSTIVGRTYHFYTDDHKFMALVDDPQPVINSGCESIIEPNFSIGLEAPRAVALYQIYQKRRLARIWQEKGSIRVFADMNVPSRYFDLNLLGIPAGWTAYANRAYARDLDHLAAAHRAARAHAGDQPITYIVYGGGGKAKALCESQGWHWLPDHTQQVHEEKNGQGTAV
jgi:hypothetical protein